MEDIYIYKGKEKERKGRKMKLMKKRGQEN